MSEARPLTTTTTLVPPPSEKKPAHDSAHADEVRASSSPTLAAPAPDVSLEEFGEDEFPFEVDAYETVGEASVRHMKKLAELLRPQTSPSPPPLGPLVSLSVGAFAAPSLLDVATASACVFVPPLCPACASAWGNPCAPCDTRSHTHTRAQ